MESTEQLTDFIPLETKARMLELQIREAIKAFDNFLFAETTTAAVPLPATCTISIAVCYGEDIIFQQEYPDVPCVDILQDFSAGFAAWCASRGVRGF